MSNITIDKLEIDSFFNDTLKIDIDRDFKASIITDTKKDKENDIDYLSTNILYITTDCNIDCDYCYQREDRLNNKKTVLSKQEIKKYFDNLVIREPNGTSTIVLFGGELFLEPENVFYCIEQAKRIKREFDKSVSLCVTTNGIWFKQEQNRLKWIDIVNSCDFEITTEISYDGSGHDRRRYKNGKSTKEDVQNVLKEFKKLNFPIYIRYTIHRDNYKHILTDMIKLCEFYKGNTKKSQRIIISTNDEELEPLIKMKTKEFMDKLKPELNVLFNRYSMPICGSTCEACMLCNFEAFNNISYKEAGLDEFIIEKGNQGNFDHFSKGNK